MGIEDRHIAAPIFVVGSPRSGTSILTWCLGHHPNILPTEESAWLGPFAVQVAAHHRLGSARGERSQLSALGIERAEFFEGFGNVIDAMILGHRARFEQLSRLAAARDPRQACPEFAALRESADPKARWVDGTPEYSLYICGLRWLFPRAKFIHLVRDPDQVAASMLAFQHEDGRPFASSVDEAYSYWFRTVQACLLAERALGAARMLRVRHADLVDAPERTMRSIMAFLGEPAVGACTAPLARRINSSFGVGSSAPRRLEVQSPEARQARELYACLQAGPPAGSPSAQALAELETEFEKRVAYARHLDANYSTMQRLLENLQVDLDRDVPCIESKNRELLQSRSFAAEKSQQVATLRSALLLCGVLLAAQVAGALAMVLVLPATADARTTWLAFAVAGLLIYAWLRRAGMRKLFTRRLAQARPRPDSNEAIS